MESITAFLMRLTSFDRFITPTLIKILYWVGVAYIVVDGLVEVVERFATNRPWPALLVLVIGIPFLILAWRVICEICVVSFRIYERLEQDKKALADAGVIPDAPTDPV